MTLIGSKGSDKKVRVSSNDTVSGFLLGKLVAGTGISLTEQNDGGNETIQVSTTISGEDLDNHAGYNLIAAASELLVEAGKNMISLGLAIEGELQIEGYLSLGD